MMRFLDASILVEACLAQSPKFTAADALVKASNMVTSAPAASIRGGSFFDAIHAQTARETRCDEIHTLNVRHFKHVAPDLTVLGL